MSVTSIAVSSLPVNGTPNQSADASLQAQFADRDPSRASEFVRRIVEMYECSYDELLTMYHSFGTPQNEWQHALVDATERLARIERQQELDDRRDYLAEQRRAEREARREFGGGYRKCRQCGRADCGHMRRGR